MIQSDSLAVVTGPVSSLHPLVHLVLLGITFLISAIAAYKGLMALAARGLDDRGETTSWALLKTLPTTQATITVGLSLSVYFVMMTMAADMIGRPISQGTQTTISFFLAAMLGIGAGQFAAKRATDAGYQKAKNAGKPGTTVNADTAEVTGGPVTVTEEPK